MRSDRRGFMGAVAALVAIPAAWLRPRERMSWEKATGVTLPRGETVTLPGPVMVVHPVGQPTTVEFMNAAMERQHRGVDRWLRSRG